MRGYSPTPLPREIHLFEHRSTDTAKDFLLSPVRHVKLSFSVNSFEMVSPETISLGLHKIDGETSRRVRDEVVVRCRMRSEGKEHWSAVMVGDVQREGEDPLQRRKILLHCLTEPEQRRDT